MEKKNDPISKYRDIIEHASVEKFKNAQLSVNTISNYKSQWSEFVHWCASRGLESLPATTETLTMFLAHEADRGVKYNTLKARIQAIRFYHFNAGLRSPTKAEEVGEIKRGIRRIIGAEIKRRGPTTVERLTEMMKFIPDNLSGLRDRAILLFGFAGAWRRSELVAIDVKNIQRQDDGVLVRLRGMKTDYAQQGRTVSIIKGEHLCPVQALEDWLKASGITNGPVFRAVLKNGMASKRRLSPEYVAVIVKKYCALIGLDPTLFGAHSLRAGFVTSALAAGASDSSVMEITGHTSVDMLKIYDRQVDPFKNHAGKGLL